MVTLKNSKNVMKLHGKVKAIASIFSSLLGLTKNPGKKDPPATSAAKIINRNYTPTSSKTLSLDLGYGSNPRNPCQATKSFGVDIRGDLERNISRADLSIEPIPSTIIRLTFAPLLTLYIPRNSYPQGKPRLAFLSLRMKYRGAKARRNASPLTPAFPAK